VRCVESTVPPCTPPTTPATLWATVRVYEGKLRTKDRFITGSEPTLTWQQRDGSSWRWETVLQFIGAVSAPSPRRR
jgi:hypothetical protein